MATTYPPRWVARVENASKLALDPESGVYRAPVPNIVVRAEAVDQRTSSYLKAEAARRKRRLSPDDEDVCRKFVLLVANWDTGTWTPRVPAANGSSPARRTARSASA